MSGPVTKAPKPSKRRRRSSMDVVDAKEAVDLATAQTYSENVFLFVPNLIGEPDCHLVCGTSQLKVLCWCRLYASHFGWIVAAFHELPSKILHSCIRHIVFTRRCGRASCQSVGSNIKIWGCFRYGHRQVCCWLTWLLWYELCLTSTWRCTTSCLLCYLSSVYPDYAILFQFLIALDFSSHYMHMYRWELARFYSYGVPLNKCMRFKLVGYRFYEPQTSHKWCQSNIMAVLQWFGGSLMQVDLHFRQLSISLSQRTLFLICAGNELFFVALYLMKWVHTPIGLGVYSTYPLSLTDITYPQAMAIISFPICFTKNIINLVQLWKASKILVGVDLAERAIAREANLKARKTWNWPDFGICLRSPASLTFP